MQHTDANLFADENTEFEISNSTGTAWLRIGLPGADFTIFPLGASAYRGGKASVHEQLRWLQTKLAKASNDAYYLSVKLRQEERENSDY